MSDSFSSDAIIIGGGLHGTSTALYLRKMGLSVNVIEKHFPGRFASGMNAGGVRRLGRDLAEIPLSDAAMKIWHSIENFIGDDCGFHKVGQVKIAETEAEMRELEARVNSVKAQGFLHEELIGNNELRDLIPVVSQNCVGGIVCRDDGAANPMKTTKAFWRRAVEENVNYYLGEKVTEIKKSKNIWKVRAGFDTFSSPILINCAGAWGDVIASMMGDYAPLKAEALTMIVTQRLPEFIQPVVGLTSGGLSFKQSSEGTLLIGGGHQGKPNRDLETAEPDPLTLSNSAKIVTRVFPSLKNVNVARVWCGLEGKMPDDIPVIGRSMTQEAGYHAFGFCGHGFQLSPIVGKLLAELIVDGKPSIPLDAFSISRFGGEQNHYIN